jgi:hypothetical protein
MRCPSCGRVIKREASPFGDGGDFFSCGCGVEGYGHPEPDGSYEVSFIIPGGRKEREVDG